MLTKRYYNHLDIPFSNPILNMSEIGTPKCPLKVYFDNVSTVDFSNIVGLRADEYSKKFAVKAGIGVDTGTFKASFETAFTSEEKVSVSNSFATGHIEITHRIEKFDLSNFTVQRLKNEFLSQSFKHDVNDNNISREELYNKYGTHLLLSVRMGGRMEFNFLHEKTAKETENSLEASVKATYSCFTGSTDVEMRKKAAKIFETSVYSSQLLGGDTSTNISTMGKAISNYSSWVKSIDNHLDFIGTGSLDSSLIIPVWDLADNDARRKMLKEAFAQILAVNGDYFKNLQKVLPKYIKDIYVGYSGIEKGLNACINNTHSVMSAADYNAPRICIEKDLNKSARGNYICLGYTLTTNPDYAIRDIRGITNEKDKCPETYNVDGRIYTKLNKNINKKTGGHFVYLYWTKNKSVGKPLLAADMEINYKFDTKDVLGWQRVQLLNDTKALNANCGTGSKTYDIFIWVKKEL